MSGIILVTGATGTVGSEVVKKLAEARLKVRALVKTKDKAWKIPAMGIELVEADYNNIDSLEKAFQDIEKMVLITPFTENMVELTKILVNQAKKHNVKHIVKLSAMGADPNAPLLAGKLHGEAEQLVINSGINYTILRSNMFMQNFVTFHKETISKQKAIYAQAGDGKASFIDVRDIAKVILVTLTKENQEGKTYSLTGPEPFSYRAAEHIFSGILGSLIKYYPLEKEEAEKEMKEAGASNWMVQAMSELYAALREGYMEDVTNTIQELTGERPTSFKQFVTDYMEEFRS